MCKIIFKTDSGTDIHIESDSGYIVRDLTTKIISVYGAEAASEIKNGKLIFEKTLEKRDAMEIANNGFKNIVANKINDDAMGILHKNKINVL
ncbi:MAG: hypothetical protein LBN03_02980 [Bifidobacteriaceae bacterium]|jgi:hypothetical protein|nr:hypothetical protein [Bifidobacteriaceae bacterium]